MRPATVFARSLAALAAVAVAALHSPTGAAAAPAAAGPACAWATEISASTLNELYPDSAAAYWVLPFPVRSGLVITLSGQYPDARYASVQVYQPGGGLFSTNGVRSALTDYLIQPDPGSVNPWQHWAPAGGNFTVTVQPDVAPGEVNTLPLAPAGVTSGTGYILYRVYLPPHRDFAAVPLPAVTFTVGGVSEQIPTCSTSTASVSATGPAPAPAAPDQRRGRLRPQPGHGRRHRRERGLRLPGRQHHPAQRRRRDRHPRQGAGHCPRDSPRPVAGLARGHAVLLDVRQPGPAAISPGGEHAAQREGG